MGQTLSVGHRRSRRVERLHARWWAVVFGAYTVSALNWTVRRVMRYVFQRLGLLLRLAFTHPMRWEGEVSRWRWEKEPDE